MKVFRMIYQLLVRVLDEIESFLARLLGERRAQVLMQLVLFGVVGVMNTLVDMGVFSVLYYAVFASDQRYYYIPFTAGYICGVVCSFVFNKLFTFRCNKQSAKRQWLPFLLVNLVAFGVGQGAMYLLGQAAITGVLAKLITVPLTLIINFAGNKLFVFRSK